jgi:hypothetical protein
MVEFAAGSRSHREFIKKRISNHGYSAAGESKECISSILSKSIID